MNNWISIKNEMPDVLESVIVLNEKGSVYEACHWSQGEFVSKYLMGKCGINAEPDISVTHWMPLPEPIDE